MLRRPKDHFKDFLTSTHTCCSSVYNLFETHLLYSSSSDVCTTSAGKCAFPQPSRIFIHACLYGHLTICTRDIFHYIRICSNLFGSYSKHFDRQPYLAGLTHEHRCTMQDHKHTDVPQQFSRNHRCTSHVSMVPCPC